MASWSDLPTELRTMIFQRVFHETNFQYIDSDNRQANNQILDLMLVTKSFASIHEIVGTMLSETALRLEKDSTLMDIKTNPKYGTAILSNVRRVSIHGIPQFPTAMRLHDLEFELPKLDQIHFYAEGVGFEEVPSIFCSKYSKLLPLLPPKDTYEHRHMVKSYPFANACLSSPFASSAANNETFNLAAAETFDEPMHLHHSGSALSTALYCGSIVGGRPQSDLDRKVFSCAKWLVLFLGDAATPDARADVTISWELLLSDDSMVWTDHSWHVIPFFLNARDMCMRFFLGDTEVIIPQGWSSFLQSWISAQQREFDPDN